MRDLTDVEPELDLHVLVFPLGVVDDRAVFGAELGELDWDGDVCCTRVANCVADVVGKRTNGKGKLIGVFGITEQAHHEVAGTDVVGQVGIHHVAEGVIADVLNDAAAIGVGAGFIELGWSQVRIAAEQQGNDGVLPGEIDELFVS